MRTWATGKVAVGLAVPLASLTSQAIAFEEWKFRQYAGGAAVFFVYVVMGLLACRRCRRSEALGAAPAGAPSGRCQFGLSTLLVVTTFAALLCGLVRAWWPGGVGIAVLVVGAIGCVILLLKGYGDAVLFLVPIAASALHAFWAVPFLDLIMRGSRIVRESSVTCWKWSLLIYAGLLVLSLIASVARYGVTRRRYLVDAIVVNAVSCLYACFFVV